MTSITSRRVDRARRVLELLDRNWTLEAIALELGISYRQVHRDLRDIRALQASGGGVSVSDVDDEQQRKAPVIPAGTACQDDPDLFYPNSDSPQAYDLPKRLCRSCPHQPDCLEWALTNDERFGVWGATSPTERQQLLRQREQGAS